MFRLLLTFCLFCAAVHLCAEDLDKMRAERVGWARLKTPSEYWFRHSKSDPVLAHFIRDNTTLNIDATWYVADVEKLDEMCAYPLLFSQAIDMIQSETGKRNLAEYVRRGGFLLIDACCNRPINPDIDLFLARQIALLHEILPDSRVIPLPNDHEVYRCFFEISGGPPHTYWGNRFDISRAKHGLYAVQLGNRTIGIISLGGLQCGWDRMAAPRGHDVLCMRMVVNIYIYAMLQGGN
ncbi:MAG: hypothetical protein QOD99_717 [Chthoniobacter sp.]|jgi:hypothetical protein|nr:hypothetical protein [Chthoniobacter sp.]